MWYLVNAGRFIRNLFSGCKILCEAIKKGFVDGAEDSALSVKNDLASWGEQHTAISVYLCLTSV